MKFSAMLLCDFYKVAHREQYPEKTEVVYSTWTPRASRIAGIDKVVNFGLQAFVKKFVIGYFNENFFGRPKADVVAEYKRLITCTLGTEKVYTQHIEDLHDLGYMPLEFRALPEGTLVPLRVPMFTVHNTDKRFYWLTNYIETMASAELWQSSTSATIANAYFNLMTKYAKETGGDTGFVQFQGHDFSFRGMGGVEAAMASGAGHLTSFVGTDTIPAIGFAEAYYNANVEKELVGTSIPATEHSVMCAYGQDELATYKRLITEVYPKGFVSIVSDTWDLFGVLANVIAPLKNEIMARDGRVVIRPDSGDPVKIVCGDPAGATEAERKGVVEVLWDIFGGTETTKGFKQLDNHIGAIYGDAITLERCEAICEGLKAKGFASTNMVYGIGSYTYQYNTRDTFGFALKSTLCVINGDEKQIFKAPKTDDGTKNSQKGRVAVFNNDGVLAYKDQLYLADTVDNDLLKPVFRDGTLLVDDTFAAIRARLTAARN